MASTHHNQPRFLVLGPVRAAWPEPLGELVRRGQVSVEGVGAMHEIAAQVSGGNGPVRGVLLDPQVLMRRDLEGVRMLATYVRLAVMMLPLEEGASIRAKEAPGYGVLMWEQAAGALTTLLAVDREPGIIEDLQPEAELPAADLTDNPPALIAASGAENSVTSQAANRYDELGIQPLVSVQELAALLGPE